MRLPRSIAREAMRQARTAIPPRRWFRHSFERVEGVVIDTYYYRISATAVRRVIRRSPAR